MKWIIDLWHMIVLRYRFWKLSRAMKSFEKILGNRMLPAIEDCAVEFDRLYHTMDNTD